MKTDAACSKSDTTGSDTGTSGVVCTYDPIPFSLDRYTRKAFTWSVFDKLIRGVTITTDGTPKMMMTTTVSENS